MSETTAFNSREALHKLVVAFGIEQEDVFPLVTLGGVAAMRSQVLQFLVPPTHHAFRAVSPQCDRVARGLLDGILTHRGAVPPMGPWTDICHELMEKALVIVGYGEGQLLALARLGAQSYRTAMPLTWTLSPSMVELVFEGLVVHLNQKVSLDEAIAVDRSAVRSPYARVTVKGRRRAVKSTVR